VLMTHWWELTILRRFRDISSVVNIAVFFGSPWSDKRTGVRDAVDRDEDSLRIAWSRLVVAALFRQGKSIG
jgi:hypothetical protein